MIDKKAMGKKSRAAGKAFELRVRAELEKTGWIVDRWTNQVEWGILVGDMNEFIPKKWKELTLKDGTHYPGPVARLVPAKPKFLFNPRTRTRQMIGMHSGFPDFIAFKIAETPLVDLIPRVKNYGLPSDYGEIKEIKQEGFNYKIIAIECKINGKLDKEEKEKCRWLLDNKIFGLILIASKGEKRRQIVYTEFK